MTNLAGVLKAEIARQSRKEVRSATDFLKKASSRYRSDIATLKRRIAELEQHVARLEKLLTCPGSAAGSPAKPRFSAAGLKKLRHRHELSAPVLASILGVSAQTIYNWEAGTTRPSQDQLARIAILRKMSRRQIQEGLARMKSS